MKQESGTAGGLEALPDYSFGPTSMGWWGVFGFMLIEGMGFVLAIGVYFYLTAFEARWPPASAPPPLMWSTVFTVVALLSEIPNVWVNRAAHRQDTRAVQIGVAVMFAVGIALLALRALEIGALNVRWDRNAYGSIVWALILLHTLHTTTDVFDSGVLSVLTFTKKMTGRRFSDVSDNALYWHFVVWSWVVLYVVVYWAPRWM